MERIRHEWDDDGCCEHCGFDGAEAHWLRSRTHPDDREPPEDYEVYCLKLEREARLKHGA
jgi:hypothetical protein